MDRQSFFEFQTHVAEDAISFENQEDGGAIVTCADGTRILVRADGTSEVITNAR